MSTRGLHEWIGIAVIVATNAAAVIPSRPDAGAPPSRSADAPRALQPAVAAPSVTVGVA